jgi:Amt family ammonium transporter
MATSLSTTRRKKNSFSFFVKLKKIKAMKKHSIFKSKGALVALLLMAFPLAGMAQDASSANILTEIASAKEGIDTVWVLLASMLVFWMQAGFAFCEAGFTRTKNTANILMKNFVDFLIGTVLFLFSGFGIMFGAGAFCGAPNLFDFSFYQNTLTIPTEAFIVFELMFCATSATIVSGAMAERTKFYMYVIYSVAISGIIYPVSGHWTWGGGFLNDLSFLGLSYGFHDFAGSTVVHSVGGILAFIGAIVLGPRLGKYTKDGKSKAIPGHSLSWASLGIFILWIGWFGFNPGSSLAAFGDKNSTLISHVFLTTNFAAATGGLAGLFTSWIKYGKPSLSLTLNGILAGLVGITAGCDCVSILGSAWIGLICGIVLVFAVEFIDKKLHVDDPVGASSVHMVCGMLGSLLVGVFATDGGLLYGGGFGRVASQAFGMLCVDGWAAFAGTVLFVALDKFRGLRVEKRIEEEGLDIYEHGESCYNN